MVVEKQFQSAISRYLVSDAVVVCSVVVAGIRFNPLYRGTCFPTFLKNKAIPVEGRWVSIRYIAVLGF